jgi:hypothetical protein
VILESLHRELPVCEIPWGCTGKSIWVVRSSTKDRYPSDLEEGARGLIPGKSHRRVEQMTKTSREKCRIVMSRRIQKRCMRFKPCNNRRKRTHQVPKASGPSILEDRCQISKPIGDLDTESSRRRSRETRSLGSRNCDTTVNVHQGGHVVSGQGSGKIPKGCGSSIQLDRDRRFKRNLDRLSLKGEISTF